MGHYFLDRRYTELPLVIYNYAERGFPRETKTLFVWNFHKNNTIYSFYICRCKSGQIPLTPSTFLTFFSIWAPPRSEPKEDDFLKILQGWGSGTGIFFTVLDSDHSAEMQCLTTWLWLFKYMVGRQGKKNYLAFSITESDWSRIYL